MQGAPRGFFRRERVLLYCTVTSNGSTSTVPYCTVHSIRSRIGLVQPSSILQSIRHGVAACRLSPAVYYRLLYSTLHSNSYPQPHPSNSATHLLPIIHLYRSLQTHLCRRPPFSSQSPPSASRFVTNTSQTQQPWLVHSPTHDTCASPADHSDFNRHWLRSFQLRLLARWSQLPG